MSTLLSLVASPCFAQTTTTTHTISVPSGVSQASVVDGTTVNIYAGWANAASNCSTATSSSLCDTCVGGADVPCNHGSIHPQSVLQIDVSSTTANINGLPIQLSTEAGSVQLVSGVVSTVATSTGYTLQIPWTLLCANGLSNGTTKLGSTCGEDGTAGTPPFFLTQSLYFGPVSAGAFVEKITLTINLSVFSSTSSTYTECPNGATGSEGGAACYFKMFGGDEKVYVDIFEPSWNLDSPAMTIGSGTAPVKSVTFFSQESPNAGADAATIAAITNSSDSFELPVSKGEDPLSDNRLNGFENGTRYCFKMTTVDVTGNIQRFTPIPPAVASDLCAEAADVIGILSDKNCFIATAAFGSSLNRHVQRFREFRNQFMATSEWGKKFIDLYYEYGPEAAASIKKNETLRSMARGMLWPLLGFVEISLHYGLAWGIFSLVMTLLVLRKLFQIFKFRLIKRSN